LCKKCKAKSHGGGEESEVEAFEGQAMGEFPEPKVPLLRKR